MARNVLPHVAGLLCEAVPRRVRLAPSAESIGPNERDSRAVYWPILELVLHGERHEPPYLLLHILCLGERLGRGSHCRRVVDVNQELVSRESFAPQIDDPDCAIELAKVDWAPFLGGGEGQLRLFSAPVHPRQHSSARLV